MRIAEGFGNEDGSIGHRSVVYLDLYALLRYTGGDDLRRVLRVAVDAAVDDEHALLFGRIAAPGEVLFHEPADVFPPQRPVQGKEILDVEPCRLFEDALHLHAVFSDDVDVVSSRVVQKVVLEVHFIRPDAAAERPERTEGVRREERARF